MKKRKYEKYITKGVVSPLHKVQFHGHAPLKRRVMLEKKSIKEEGIKIVVHEISKLPKEINSYCEPHKHDCDEINIILSEDNSLTYSVVLGDEKYKVKAPATIYIPAGLSHCAEVLSGKGAFVAIILTGNYKASKGDKK